MNLLPLLTIKESCELLKVSPQDIYNMINRGDLVAVKLGNRILIPRNRVLSLLDENKQAQED
jgi:excisionase family DNA binding protein